MSSPRSFIHSLSKKHFTPKSKNSFSKQWTILNDHIKVRIDKKQNQVVTLNLETGIENNLAILKKSEILRVFPISQTRFAILSTHDLELWDINHDQHSFFYKTHYSFTLPHHQFLLATSLDENNLVAIVRQHEKFSLFLIGIQSNTHKLFPLQDCLPTQLVTLAPDLILIQDHLRNVQIFQIDSKGPLLLGKQKHWGGISSESITVSPDQRYLYESHLIYNFLCFYLIKREEPFLDEIEIKGTELSRLQHLHSYLFKQGFLPDGRFVFVEGKKQNKLTLFNLETCQFIAVLEIPEGPIVNLTISPYGQIDILTAKGIFLRIYLTKSDEEKKSEKHWQHAIFPFLDSVGIEKDSASVIAEYSYPGLFFMKKQFPQSASIKLPSSEINLGPR